MSTAFAIALCAALFAAFGLVMRLQRAYGHGSGCSSCSSVCHRKESRHV